MKVLIDILNKVSFVEIFGNTEIDINALNINSNNCEQNSLFVAVKGSITDGHTFIKNAIENGAIAILCEDLPVELNADVTYIKVRNAQKSLGFVAANFYDNPSENIGIVGITGTNGKSTVATLCFNLFKTLGYKVGLISTIEYKIDSKNYPSINTTPNAIVLNKLFAEMVDEGCEYCFMEISSHAIHQNRIEGIEFAGGLFTNLSHDHLDYHKDFKEYLNIKKQFFDNLSKDAFAITNSDDKNGLVMLQNSAAIKKTYGIKSLADFKAKVLENSFRGLILNIEGDEVYSLLIGNFNAYNLLAVFSIASMLEIEKIEILTALSTLKNAEGRLDVFRLEAENIVGFIDYAHSPDAVLNVLSTVNDIRDGRGNLISVIGCGGDRDKKKRPLMAQIACKFSDKVILTSDNPRNESIESIIDDMLEGIEVHHKKKILKINDRKEAIKTACHFASNGDVVAVLGKGHEKYQEINGEKFPFDDKVELVNALNEIIS